MQKANEQDTLIQSNTRCWNKGQHCGIRQNDDARFDFYILYYISPEGLQRSSESPHSCSTLCGIMFVPPYFPHRHLGDWIDRVEFSRSALDSHACRTDGRTHEFT